MGKVHKGKLQCEKEGKRRKKECSVSEEERKVNKCEGRKIVN